MTKNFVLAALLASTATFSFAQAPAAARAPAAPAVAAAPVAAPMPTTAAKPAKKHGKKKAKKAVNPVPTTPN